MVANPPPPFQFFLFSIPVITNWSHFFKKSSCFFSTFRKEIEPFLPPLKPEFCVKQAMRAILTDQPMICTPRIVYMVNFMKRWAIQFFKVISPSAMSEVDLRDVSAASCPSKPLCVCTGSWVQISACTPSWLRERRQWTTTKQRMGSRGCCPTWTETRKPTSTRKETTVDDLWSGGWGRKERLNRDWCTCIEQMQRFHILFLWNKESCVLHKGFIWLCFVCIKKTKKNPTSIFCH